MASSHVDKSLAEKHVQVSIPGLTASRERDFAKVQAREVTVRHDAVATKVKRPVAQQPTSALTQLARQLVKTHRSSVEPAEA